jgi:hypothetical protein
VHDPHDELGVVHGVDDPEVADAQPTAIGWDTGAVVL